MQVIDRHYEEAIASAKRAVAIGPGDAGAHIALGYVQLFAGNHAEAANAVETALKLDPNLPPMDREIAGLVFLLQGDTAKAIETLERTRDDAPADGGFRILLAAAYARAGRLEDAKAAIAEGLRVTSRSESPARRRSLAAWRHSYANFRNAEDLSSDHRRHAPSRLARVAVQLHRRRTESVERRRDRFSRPGPYTAGSARTRRQPAIMQVAQDGTAGFRTMTRMLT